MLRRNREALVKFCQLVGFFPHAGQKPIMRAFISGVRFLVIVCGRRWGKSQMCAVLAAYALAERDCHIWVVSKTYDLANKVYEYLVKYVSIMYPQARIQDGRPDKRIELPWGSWVQLKSADHPASLIGEGLDLLIFDECAEVQESIWLRKLSPTLRDRKGTVLFITTPLGRNWIYSLFCKGQAHEAGYASFQSPSWVNTCVWDQAELALAREQLDEISFRQQHGAEFVAFANMVYPMFDHYENVQPAPDDLQGWTITLCVDPGYNGACALLWVAHDEFHGIDHVIREVVEPRLTFESVLEIIQRFEPPGRYEALVVDIAGRAESQQSGQSFVSWMEASDWFQERGYYWDAAQQGIIEGVNMVRARLQNAAGARRLFVDPCCEKLIYALENYAYKEGSMDELPFKDGVTDHPCDALRYGLMWRYNRAVARALKGA